MLRTIALDQQTILYLGVLIGAATKQNEDPFVHKAAENIFNKVYEFPIPEMPDQSEEVKLLDFSPSLVHDFFNLRFSQRRKIIVSMGFCLSSEQQRKIIQTSSSDPGRENAKMFLFEMKKQGRLSEVVEHIQKMENS